MRDSRDLPIAVIGAGPTGLTLAGLLASAGTRTVLIERNETTSTEPKAISCDDETLRCLARAGLAASLDDVLVPGVGTKYLGRNGRTLVYARGSEPPRFGYPVKSPFAQPDFERELLRAIISRGDVDVRMGNALLGLTQSPDRVTLELAPTAGETSSTQLEAAFVVGCDGGRSSVRSALGISMCGRSFTERWLVLDTLHDHHDGRYALHVGDPARPHVIIAGRDGACRYEFLLRDGEARDGAADLELVTRLLAPYRQIERRSIARQCVYTFHALVADRFRAGRGFIAGDAAHMMPPFAGQGMNSGIRDADNLSWKMAAVWRGDAPESLLDTYERERRPHVEQMVQLSTRLGAIVMTTSRLRAAARDVTITVANRIPAARRWLGEMRFRPRPHYTDGLVRHHPGGVFPIVGRMFPQPRVLDARGSTSLLDEHLGDGWSVVLVDPREATVPVDVVALADRVQGPVISLLLDDRLPWHGDCVAVLEAAFIAELRALRDKVVLLRPDRYVAAITSWGEARAALAWIDEALSSAGEATPTFDHAVGAEGLEPPTPAL